MSDFSDRPFVAGSLTGLRAFDVDKYGRLCGPSFHEVFKPGENEARCAGRGLAAGGVMWTFHPIVGDPTVSPPVRKPKAEKPKHQVGAENCACGYYAYFDGKNDYARANRVSAIIEGYGVCTVGDRGFRAEKAKLVALVIPDQRKPRNPFDRIPRSVYEWLYRQHGWPIAPCVAGGVLSAMGALVGATSLSLWMLSLLLVSALCGAGLYVTFHSIGVHFGDTEKSERPPFDKVRTNYPDVPVYGTQRAALRAHPVTAPEGVLPTPDQDDFWARPVSL